MCARSPEVQLYSELYQKKRGQNVEGGRNDFKLKESRFRLNIRQIFFILRVVRHWYRLPREFVDAPSLEVFKTRLDGALSNLVECRVRIRGTLRPFPIQTIL